MSDLIILLLLLNNNNNNNIIEGTVDETSWSVDNSELSNSCLNESKKVIIGQEASSENQLR